MYHIESKQVSGQQFNQGIRKTCMCQYTKQADAQGNGVSGIACTDLLKPAFWKHIITCVQYACRFLILCQSGPSTA